MNDTLTDYDIIYHNFLWSTRLFLFVSWWERKNKKNKTLVSTWDFIKTSYDNKIISSDDLIFTIFLVFVVDILNYWLHISVIVVAIRMLSLSCRLHRMCMSQNKKSMGFIAANWFQKYLLLKLKQSAINLNIPFNYTNRNDWMCRGMINCRCMSVFFLALYSISHLISVVHMAFLSVYANHVWYLILCCYL